VLLVVTAWTDLQLPHVVTDLITLHLMDTTNCCCCCPLLPIAADSSRGICWCRSSCCHSDSTNTYIQEWALHQL
jgi:hypothetical protein